MKYYITILLVVFYTQSFAGPYAPPQGQAGSTTVHLDDPNIIAWATDWQDYLVGSECDTEWQTPDNALGQAQGIVGGVHHIVSLGRGGEITLVFDSGIGDRQGYDFVVFENAVNHTFLELAFVEVSSDGVYFFGFYNDSLTPSSIGAYSGFDTTNITGYAGKYIHSYGTPFDLAELRGVSPLLDVDNIRYVCIVDIVGDGTYLDTSDKPIYDPYPTIGSAGFDLDGIGVINMRSADFDQSGGVCTDDLSIFAAAWMSNKGDANWDQRCDIVYPEDERIDFSDFAVLSRQWMQTCGNP